MIDINELRTAAEAAGLNAISMQEVLELLDRLARAEKTNRDWLRANAPGGWIDDLRMKRNDLQAKIDAMEKRLRLILEEPENTLSNSKALREVIRQAKLALEESK